MMPILLRLASVVLCFGLFSATQLPDISDLADPLSPGDHLLADQLASSITNTEWLGVLAPIAISPFFGITCLAGMSQFGGDLLGANSFISTNPVLNNPIVLWVFLGLTMLTSLPRLTKVSKPVAQAVDQLEAYSGIVTLLIMRFMVPADVTESPEQVVMQMGLLSFSFDVLISIAAIINILVINTVKFFFEVLVWLTPFPFVDALLEAANKATCAVLLTIYAYSPLVATIINIVLFISCLFVFFWVRRRVGYIRSIIYDPIWALLNRHYGVPTKNKLVVFTSSSFKSYPARAKLIMEPTENGWNLTQQSLISYKPLEISGDNRIEIRPGMLNNTLVIEGSDAGTLYFSRRYSSNLAKLATNMNFGLVETSITDSVTGPEIA